MSKKVYRTTGGPITGFRHIGADEPETERADADDPEVAEAKRKWAEVLEYFARPIKAGALQTDGYPRHAHFKTHIPDFEDN